MNWYLTATQEPTLAPALEPSTEATAQPKPRRTLSVLLCRHNGARWPVNGRQECLDCLGWRPYVIGGEIGRWRR